jgi:hypothetical protein
VFDPLVTKTAKRGFYVVDLFRATWNPSMATLSTDLPKYAQTGRRASGHIVRKSMDRPSRRLARRGSGAGSRANSTTGWRRDSRDRWHVRGKGEISMATRDRVRVPAVLSVGARGFEPLTSSASRKRSPPELSARGFGCYRSLRGGDLHRVSGAARMSARD